MPLPGPLFSTMNPMAVYMDDQKQLWQGREEIAKAKLGLRQITEQSGLLDDLKTIKQDDPMSRLMAMQEAAISHGQIDQADKVSNIISQMAYRSTLNEMRKATTEKTQAQTAENARKGIFGLISGAQNQEDFQQRVGLARALFPSMPEDVQQILQQPWSKDLMTQLRDSFSTPLDRAKIGQAEAAIEKAKSSTELDKAKRLTEDSLRQSKIESQRALAAEREAARLRQVAATRREAANADLAEAKLKQQSEHADKVGKEGGKPAKLSANERANADQLIRAGNEVFAGFDEILKMGPQGRGTFADLAYHNEPSFIGAWKKWAANKITPDEAHMYAARLAGVNVAAATIATGGRAPRVSQMEAESQALSELSGQSRRVFYDKIHQASLKAIRGIELTRTDDPEQKQNLELVLKRLKRIESESKASLDKLSKPTPQDPSRPNITKEAYDKLKPGDTYWWNGEQMTKKGQ